MSDRARFAALFALFAAAALGLYWPALRGEFVSDDLGYIVTNVAIHDLSWTNALSILDPWGEPALYTANYAPVHLLAHAVEWAAWESDTLGYHVVNVVLHAFVSVLLAAFLVRRGVAFGAAALAGAVFLVHPANVEAVAWIFQLKTILALGLVLGALLLHPRRPLPALLLYVLALLSKAQALVALPVAAVLAWSARDPGDPQRRRWRWLLAWALVSLVYAVPQMFAFEHLGATDVSAHPDPLVRLRTIAAIGCRYLVMAATGTGLSAFQEPEPALSWLDPWWLGALVLGGALAARCVWALARRREEAAFWVWAAAAFAPVSQIFPFLHPIADRYLYFILPGLLGGVLLAGRDAWPALAPRVRAAAGRLHPSLDAATAVAAACALLLVVFAAQAVERARIWRSEITLTLDAAAHYPDGLSAHYLAARRAAREGDAERAARELRAAAARGWDRFFALRNDPALGPVLETEPMQALVRDLAADWIEKSRAKQPTQSSLRVVAMAHVARDELPQAIAALEEALRLGGPRDDLIREELRSLRATLRTQQRTTGGE
jgi:hypothetical protein